MARSPTLNAIFTRYRGRMRRLLYEARAYVRDEKYWVSDGTKQERLACSPIIAMDSSGEGEWRLTFVVHRRLTRAEKRHNAGMPAEPFEFDNDDLDIIFGIVDSKDSDGTEGGMTFSVEFCTIGGSPCGGLTPYNYSPDVWVPIADKAAVEERFKIFESMGGAEMGAAIVSAWQRQHP